MQKTRILYLITKSNFGGAQKYVYELATSLDKELFEVSVALGGEGVLKDKLEEAGIKIIPIPGLTRDISFFKEFSILGFLIKLFKKEKPDVVHVNSAKAGGIGSLAARLTGVPKIIFTAHGWEFNSDRSAIEKIFFKFLSWITVLITHKTIAVSESIKKPLIGLPFIYNKFKVIWNGVKPIEFLEKEEAKNFLASKNNKLDTTKKWIGATSELHPVKGIDVLINSAKEVLNKEENKDVQFLVMGDGQLKEKLQKQINESGLSDNFILMGYVDNASQYLKALNIFVLSSHSEALSLAILEAGLSSTPVVATRVGGIPEVIIDNELGRLVEPANSTDLANAINEMLSNEDKAKNMAIALNKRVSTDFSYDNMLDKTVGLYNRD